MNDVTPGSARNKLWALVILLLLAARLPALVEPAGSDQSLYMYVADRVLDGGVPYVDAWDQKPPAVFFLYAPLRAVWPHASAVGVADIAAAAALAWSLTLLGRRTMGWDVGLGAAALALLFGHPSLSRLSGVYIRGQCETFIAPAVTIALVLVARAQPKRSHLVWAGVALGVAFWLRYNAIVYVLPVALAVVLLPAGGDVARRRTAANLGWIASGFGLVGAVTLAYFAAHGALGELRLATIDYNLRYAGETYRSGLLGALGYLVTMPLNRIRAEMLWFLGAAGAVSLLLTGTWTPPPRVGSRARLAGSGCPVDRHQWRPRSAAVLRSGRASPGLCGGSRRRARVAEESGLARDDSSARLNRRLARRRRTAVGGRAPVGGFAAASRECPLRPQAHGRAHRPIHVSAAVQG